MPSTSGTVRALAERLAQDDDLRARLVDEPQAVLDEWGVSAAGDVLPETVTLPSAAELAGLVTASREPPEAHEAEEPVVHEVDRPEEVHEAEEPQEVHEAEEPEEVHEAEELDVHELDSLDEDD